MIIYEVSNRVNDSFGELKGYTDHKFYIHHENADRDWHKRLDNKENASYFIRNIEDWENEDES